MSEYLYFVDAAYPPVPQVGDGVAFYIGGDTPHVWTKAELAKDHHRYRLPIFVRSNPPGPGADVDVNTAITQLHAIGAPAETLVAWDMETAADASYIQQVFLRLKGAGWKLLVYGSQSSIFGNKNPDGLYWGADWIGTPKIMGGDVMTQYVNHTGYDESIAGYQPGTRKQLPFWDTLAHPANGPHKQTANGNQSLLEVAEARHTTVGHLIDLTLKTAKGPERVAFVNYISGVKMPAGLVFYTTNP